MAGEPESASKEVSPEQFSAIDIRAGRIVDNWETWDLLGILEQIGGVRRADSASA